MYKVLCDNALMCDSRIEELALLNPVVTLEENKAGSFSFTITPGHPLYDAIQKRKSLVQVYQDDNEEPLFSGICIEETKDFYKQKKIYCEGELTFFNDSVQRPARYQNYSVRGLLEAYIANHNTQVEEAKQFTVGQVTVTDPNDSLYCYTNMESTMKALKEDLVDDLGGFFRIRHVDGIRYLDYLAESPNTNTQSIKIGKNLMDFTTNIDSSDIATAIIPLGCVLEESSVEGLDTRLTIESVNDGLDYVHSAEAVATYGWIYKTVEWDGVTTPTALKTKGEQYLSDIQFENMVIQAKAVDLHLTDKEIEQFKVSDQIRVVSAPHGLNRYFRLSKMTVNLNNPEKNTITLGKSEKLTLSAKSNQANEAIKKAIKRIVPADSILKSAAENATQLIQNSMNGYITTVMNEDGSPKELLIMDTPNIETATKVWRWNINGLGYSSTGYNGEYSLAMTMDGGIVADFITSGKMKANRISGGTLLLGGENNANGVLIMHDSQGNEIGIWDNNGIRIKSADDENLCDFNNGYIYFKKEGEVHSGIGANTLETAGNILKTLTLRSYTDVIVFSHENTPYYVINPKGMELTDNKYTEAHYFKGSARFLDKIYANGDISTNGNVSASEITASGDISGKNITASKLKLSNGVEIYRGTWLDAITALINSNMYVYGVLGCAKDITASGDISANGNMYAKTAQSEYVIATETLQGKNAVVQDTIEGDSLVINKMGIAGGAIQNVEWVWDSTLKRYVLCTVT